MQTLAIINRKGGVGKTTVTTWLSQGLALQGKKVLVVDNDPQHDLSDSLAITPPKATIRDVYVNPLPKINQTLTNAVQETAIENLYILPSTFKLAHADVPDSNFWNNIIEESTIKDYFDFLIFDNAPGNDDLQFSTILAADTIVIPTELKKKAASGLYELYQWLTKNVNFLPSNIKIIPNAFRRIKKQVFFLDFLHETFPESVTTAIPHDEVFDDLDIEEKVLFFSRLKTNRVLPYIIKILEDVLGKPSDEIELSFIERQKKFLSDTSRSRMSNTVN